MLGVLFTVVLCVIFFIIVFGQSLMNAIYDHKENKTAKVKYNMKKSDFNSLSWPAQQTVRTYFALPAANRPFDNLFGILRALDTKHGVSKVNKHFQKAPSYYDSYQIIPSWKNGCRGCNICTDYVNLCSGLNDIKIALDEQAHAIQMAAMSDALWAGKIAIERMNEEREIIRRVTKEITA